MPNRPLEVACLIVSLPLVLGGPAQPVIAQAVARDSAGIRIVENTRDQGTNVLRWRVEETPFVDLSKAGVGAEYELFRVFSGVVLRDGRIVVANSSSNELRVYSEDGRFMTAIGREGEGPGEFTQLNWVGRYRGDSIFAYDYGLGRWSIFSEDGEFARSARVTTPEGQRVEAAQPFSSGAVMGMRLMPPGNSIGRELIGLHQGETSLMRFSPEGDYLNSIAAVPGPELWLPERPPDQTYYSYLPALFGYWPWWAVGSDLVFIGTDHGFEVAGFSESQGLRRLFRILGPERELSRSEVDDFLARVEVDYNPGMARSLAALPRPETCPPFSRIVVDRDGDLWVSEYVQLQDDPQTWTVFRADGALLGDVVVPHRFLIFDIGSDFILGRHRDELNVEHVQVYRLNKDEGIGAGR